MVLSVREAIGRRTGVQAALGKDTRPYLKVNLKAKQMKAQNKNRLQTWLKWQRAYLATTRPCVQNSSSAKKKKKQQWKRLKACCSAS
jgi:hypothetical protein